MLHFISMILFNIEIDIEEAEYKNGIRYYHIYHEIEFSTVDVL